VYMPVEPSEVDFEEVAVVLVSVAVIELEDLVVV